MKSKSRFGEFAKKSAAWTGRSWAFTLAVMTIVVWGITGPIFHFSDTWQLVINTGTTVITFLMVFLIQNTQNRDTAAIHLKLDELIRVSRGHNALIGLEELDSDELAQVRNVYEKLAEEARRQIARGKSDTNSPRARPVHP